MYQFAKDNLVNGLRNQIVKSSDMTYGDSDGYFFNGPLIYAVRAGIKIKIRRGCALCTLAIANKEILSDLPEIRLGYRILDGSIFGGPEFNRMPVLNEAIAMLGTTKEVLWEIEAVFQGSFGDWRYTADWIEKNVQAIPNPVDMDKACPDDSKFPPPTSTTTLRRILEQKEVLV